MLGVLDEDWVLVVGDGVVLYVMDFLMIFDIYLIELIEEIVELKGIKC